MMRYDACPTSSALLFEVKGLATRDYRCHGAMFGFLALLTLYPNDRLGGWTRVITHLSRAS